jgi:hypothetical protein
MALNTRIEQISRRRLMCQLLSACDVRLLYGGSAFATLPDLTYATRTRSNLFPDLWANIAHLTLSRAYTRSGKLLFLAIRQVLE